MFFLQPNQKRLLNSLNPLFLGLFALGLILVRTTSEPLLPGFFQKWDVLLPFIIYFGQRRGMIEALLLVLITSHLYSLCSSAPIGVFAAHYLIIFIIARLLSYIVYANTGFSVFLLLLSLAFLSRLTLPFVAFLFGHGWPIFSWENFRFFSLVLNAVVGFVVYWCLVTLDRLTYKVPRINIELAETSL